MSQYIITEPTARTVHTISLEKNPSIKLDFNPTDTQVERTDNDLSVQFPNQGIIILSDFFVTDGAELPTLVLQDGTEIASTDLLASLDPTMDISTAAGPTTSDSSGLNAYGDGSGDLLDGLDRLDSLESFFWSGQGPSLRLEGLSPFPVTETEDILGDTTPPTPGDPSVKHLGPLKIDGLGAGEGLDDEWVPENLNVYLPGFNNPFMEIVHTEDDDVSLFINSADSIPHALYTGNGHTGQSQLDHLIDIKAGNVTVGSNHTVAIDDPHINIYNEYSGITVGGPKAATRIKSTTGDIEIKTNVNVEMLTEAYGTSNNRGYIELDSAKNITISSKTENLGDAYGVYSNYNSQTVITAQEDVSIDAYSARGTAYGLNISLGANNGYYNQVTGQTVTIGATSLTQLAVALNGSSGGGLNKIISDNAIISADGATKAIGLQANFGAALHKSSNSNNIKLNMTNHVVADNNIDLSVKASNGDAYGLLASDEYTYGDSTIPSYADVDAQNILEAGNSITVTVEGTGIAQAMHASGSKSSNLIMAGEGMDASDDANINITGDMYAERAGSNTIQTFGGNDNIIIKGDISAVTGGENTIDSGAGDDIITLNGAIAEGALTIRAGEGTDTLVLKAGSISEFNENYKEWLEDLTTNAMKGMSIEKISIELENGLELSDLKWLNDYIGELGASNISLTIDGNEVDWDTVLSATKVAGLFADETEVDTALDAFVESFSHETAPQQFHTGDSYLPEISTEDISLYILQSVTGL